MYQKTSQTTMDGSFARRNSTKKLTNDVGLRKQPKTCPVDGCGAHQTDLKQHILHCHRQFTAEQVRKAMHIELVRKLQ
jgi:hypothetical protein